MKLISGIFIVLFCGLVAAEYRSFDGTNNNLQNPTWGSTGIRLVRLGGPTETSYADGISQIRTNLPSARVISNIVFGGNPNYQPISAKGLSDFATYWGQFIDHDLDLTGGMQPPEATSIVIPVNDSYFDPMGWGNVTLPMGRSKYDPLTGTNTSNPRQQVNQITSFLDASMVYGSDNNTASLLRTGNGGMLKTSNGSHGILPPRNTFGLSMANDARKVNQSELFAVGDVRGNENPALTAIHTVFLREHNRLAAQFAQQHSTWNDEQLYQEARKWVTALIQRITWKEYMPAILGESPEYTGYNATKNPSILTEFSTGAFRYGHTEVSSTILRLDNNRQEIALGSLSLRDYFFNPVALDEGIEPLLIGMAEQPQREVDTHFVDDIRNYLFGQPGQGGLDLAAVNTHRGRDHGIPSFNRLRELLGLPKYTSWTQITTNITVSNALKAAYNDIIDDCEIYVCGLAEDHPPGSNIGTTLHAVVKEQYLRWRDGDRFWYQNTAVSGFTSQELAEIENTTFSHVILRNTNIQYLQCFVMATPLGCYLGTKPSNNGTTTGSNNVDFVVTEVPKTAAHPYFNEGDSIGYAVNGVEGAELTLVRGQTYTFKADITCIHSLYMSTSPAGNAAGWFRDGVTLGNGATEACQGAILTFVVPSTADPLMWYQCINHDKMGWKMNIVDYLTTGATTAVGTTGSATSGNEATTGTIIDLDASDASRTGVTIIVLVMVALLSVFYF